MFLTKMSAARFVALERIDTHELGEFEEIGHATGAFERLIEILSFAGNAHRSPKFVAQLRNFRERFAQSLSVSGHATFVPEKRSELTMDGVERTIAVDAKDAVDLNAYIGLGFFEFGVIGGGPFAHLTGEIIGKRVGQDEITVGQTLHQRARAKPVGAVIGKVCFSEHMQRSEEHTSELQS